MIPLVQVILETLPEIKKRGRVYLYLLVREEGSFNRHDLLISADWSDADIFGTIRTLAYLLHPKLRPEDKDMFSRIVVIPSSDPQVRYIASSFKVTDSVTDLRDEILFGREIRRGYLFCAEQPPHAVEQVAQAVP